ncbi:MAG: hypothetical protein CMH07_08155 [Marinovum sp.]|nr:hypothetical protein [Marinovum sp.]
MFLHVPLRGPKKRAVRNYIVFFKDSPAGFAAVTLAGIKALQFCTAPSVEALCLAFKTYSQFGPKLFELSKSIAAYDNTNITS